MKSAIWFNNLVIYQFTAPFNLSGLELEEKLKDKTFRPCGSHDLKSYGWAPALGKKSSALVHELQNCLLIRAVMEEKILPSSVVRDAVEQKVEVIEFEQDRQVFSKERRMIKDDVVFELLPKAFTKQKQTLAYIDKKAGLIFINSSSFKQAEELTSCLRECLGSLPVITPKTDYEPASVMTRWLNAGKIGDKFQLGGDCVLREPGDSSSVIITRNEESISDTLETPLSDGKQVSKLAIEWDRSISAIITEDFRVNRLKYHEEVILQSDQNEFETVEQHLDADFAIMTGVLRQFTESLVSQFMNNSSP